MHPQDPRNLMHSGFEIPAIRMLPYWRIRFLAPADEIDALFDEIIKVAPLVYGKTDSEAMARSWALSLCPTASGTFALECSSRAGDRAWR